MVYLGNSGWRAEWDSALDPYTDLNFLTQTADAVFVQRAVEFTEGSVGGVFPGVAITFRQIAWPAAANVVIDDEIMINNTGESWGGFRMRLEGDAAFDADLTLLSGTWTPIGFNILPFNEAAFSGDMQRLNIWDGVVSDSDLWFPGDGEHDGALWINAHPQTSAPYNVFTLTDMPTPEPASLSLLAVGCVAMIQRQLRRTMRPAA